ncbi:MAG: GtrA family protein [Oscillospiraceae bacterium]|nr:GtrA family protein [Oscillospiraceae bacterium]
MKNLWLFAIGRFPWLVKFRRFLKFGIVGASNTLIYLAVYYGLLFAFSHYGIDRIGVGSYNLSVVYPAVLAAFLVSVVNAYLWNKLWVFGDRKTDRSTPIKFFIIYGGNLAFNMSFAYLWEDILYWNQFLLPIVSLCITVPINFLLNKKWAFKTVDS